MAGVITDLIDRVSDSSTGRPIIANLAAPGKGIGAASINLDAATNWTTSSAIHFSIYETVTIGSTTVKNPATQTDWKGTLSGVAIGNLTLTGGTDRAYTAGAKVEITPTARYAKDLYDWAMTHAEQNGNLKTASVVSALTAGTVTNTMLAGGITNDKLSTTAGELGGAWTTYTPTFTGLTVGNATVTARYTKVGKTVTARVRVALGSTSAVTGSITASLPVTSATYTGTAPLSPIGDVFYFNGSTVAMGPVVWASTTTATLYTYNAAGTYLAVNALTATVPFAWANTHEITLNMTYEAA